MSLSADRQALVKQVAANFLITYRSRGLGGINAAITACYSRAAQLKTVRAIEYCYALDITAMDVAKHDQSISPFNSLDEFRGRVEELEKIVVLPKGVMDEGREGSAVVRATVNAIREALASPAVPP